MTGDPDAEAEALEAEAEAEQERLRELAADVDGADLLAYEPTDYNDRTLCAYLRQCQQIESETARVKQQMEAMLAALGSRRSRLDWLYLPEVQRIVDERLRGKKAKSIKTPWGTAGYRTLQPKLEIMDVTKLLAAADTRPEMNYLIVVQRSIGQAKLNDFFKTTGELPDGVDLIPKREKFFAE